MYHRDDSGSNHLIPVTIQRRHCCYRIWLREMGGSDLLPINSTEFVAGERGM